MKGKMLVQFNAKREVTVTLEHECGERIEVVPPFFGPCVMKPEYVLEVVFEGDNLSVGPFMIPVPAATGGAGTEGRRDGITHDM